MTMACEPLDAIHMNRHLQHGDFEEALMGMMLDCLFSTHAPLRIQLTLCSFFADMPAIAFVPVMHLPEARAIPILKIRSTAPFSTMGSSKWRTIKREKILMDESISHLHARVELCNATEGAIEKTFDVHLSICHHPSTTRSIQSAAVIQVEQESIGDGA